MVIEKNTNKDVYRNTEKIRVLFMQSQTYFGADSRLHALLMQHFDPKTIEVHAACNYGSPERMSTSARELEKIPNLHLRSTYFGPSVNSRQKRNVFRDAVFGTLPTFRSLTSLAAYARSQNIDIVHCTEKPRDAFYGYWIARYAGAKCLIHLHVKAEDWISPLTQWAMHRADALVGVSNFVADSIVAMGFAPEKTYTVLNAMDISNWDPCLDGSPIREEFGLSENDPMLLVVSRLFYWKGHSELLRALAIVKSHFPNVKLLVVGEDDPRGHPGGGSYRAELEELVKELDLGASVIFTGFRRDIPMLMAACDIYAMPSFEEPFGMVYLEAMAMEKPVVALDNGGAREIVAHGKSGLLSQPHDIVSLANNICDLLTDVQLRNRMGLIGRKRIEDYFSPARMSMDMEAVYRSILSE